MAHFDKKSRYVKNSSVVDRVDAEGRPVRMVLPARRLELVQLGEHRLREGQRLDHLASYYLDDPTAFWRICELNDVMLPDALAEVETVRIPTKI